MEVLHEFRDDGQFPNWYLVCIWYRCLIYIDDLPMNHDIMMMFHGKLLNQQGVTGKNMIHQS